MTSTNELREAEQALRQRAEERLEAGNAEPAAGTLPPVPAEVQKLIHDLRVHQIELEMQNEELRTTQLELEASRARYFNLYDLAPAGYLTLDAQGRIREVNRAAADMLGADLSSLINRPMVQFILPADQDVYYLYHKRTGEAGPRQGCELRLTRADGSPFWGRLQAATAGSDGWLVTLHDISDSKRAEEEKLEMQQHLHQARKMESLGVLVGGIAHDFNNILAIIIGHCSLARLRPDTTEKHLPAIERAAGRAAELCRLMLTYAGKSKPDMTPVNMGALLNEMVTMLKSSIRQNAAITTDLPAGDLYIRGDASQIRQIVMNLIINASEAIGEAQGDIRVGLAPTLIGPGQLTRDHFGNDIPGGRYACLEVADSGCGMDDEIRQHIFDPFYTTKVSGSGLGLSATLGIIMAHGGALQCCSRPGSGTTFKVYLPVCAIDTADTRSQPVPDKPWQGSGTVLLVDDEELIRHATGEMLAELGFSVLEAANGSEAIDRYRENPGAIDLVVTDIGMPVMDGYAICRRLKELGAALPVIITSGFGDAVVSEQLEDLDIAGLLSKPYSFDQLRTILRRVVQEAPRS
jgi:PAS domain S-box-containing protein